MDGYVKGSTDFEHAIYGYISDIKIADVAETINLFYINSEIIPFGNDIENFIDRLEPDTFKSRGGIRKTSDIANVLKTVLSETKETTVSIFVSDCVFSPGKGKDAKEYLINQQIGIKNIVADQLKKQPELAITIFQLTSQFDGLYFNSYDDPKRINDRRPFYIWLMGDKEHVATFRSTVKDFRGNGIVKYCTLLPVSGIKDYRILQTNKHGSFKRDRKNPRTHIYDIEKASNGKNANKFVFTIGTDFSFWESLLGKEYLLDADNYARIVNKSTEDELLSIRIYEEKMQNSQYLHNIELTAENNIPFGELKIALLQKPPFWIYTINDDAGIDIYSDGAMQKTFGIKYMIEGVYEAYEAIGHGYYTEMNFKLSKREG